MVAKLDPRWYFAEPELKDCPFQYGALHDGRLINLDILRYQHAIANLVLTGVMAQVEQWSPGRRTVCEIGSGSGCFAFNLRRSLGDVALVLVDIPVSLFLTGAFLIVNDPEARLAIVDQDTPRGHLAELIASHDYILVADSMADRLLEGRYDLFFNLYSFQEMPSATVRRYLEIARLTTRGAFYSENLRGHAKNPENTDSIDDLIHDHLDAFPDPAFYQAQDVGDEVMRPIIGVGPLVGGSLSIRGELLLGYAGRVVTLRPPGS
nr:putative sugar O-methyltransferase [Roseospira visakhapatnamensis]